MLHDDLYLYPNTFLILKFVYDINKQNYNLFKGYRSLLFCEYIAGYILNILQYIRETHVLCSC